MGKWKKITHIFFLFCVKYSHKIRFFPQNQHFKTCPILPYSEISDRLGIKTMFNFPHSKFLHPNSKSNLLKCTSKDIVLNRAGNRRKWASILLNSIIIIDIFIRKNR